jgi:aryl-alcohol dehydrogenase-like predicted oxidoreductase
MDGLDWLRERNLTEDNLNKLKAIGTLSKELNLSLANLAIAWCIKNPNVSTAILGASKINQLEENFKSLEILEQLTPELMQKIDETLKNKPEHPLY